MPTRSVRMRRRYVSEAILKPQRRNWTAGGSVGRKLDFIAQEMNREANTILSKVQ